MKYLYALTLLAALSFSLPLHAQNVEKKENQKVIVIKKTIDDNGNIEVEEIKTTYGDAANMELDDAVITVDVIKADEIEGNGSGDMQEITVDVEVEEDGDTKVVRIRRNGEEKVMEWKGGNEVPAEMKEVLEKEGVIIEGEVADEFEDGFGNRIHEMAERIAHLDFMHGHHRARVAKAHGKSNCVALGVFVGTRDGGAKVSSIIDGSGAEDAGLQSGDLIRGINDDKVFSVRSLHEALAKYEPGDVVTVSFEREGEQLQVDSELRQWGELPDYEDSWRAKVKCGDANYKEEYNFLASPKVTRKVIIIKKGQDGDEEILNAEVPELNASPIGGELNGYALNLANYKVFPNPNDGKFRIQFEAEAKPLTVSIFDASGREVFRDNMSDFNGFYNKEIDLSNKLRGQAVVSIAQDGKRYSEMLIIQ